MPQVPGPPLVEGERPGGGSADGQVRQGHGRHGQGLRQGRQGQGPRGDGDIGCDKGVLYGWPPSSYSFAHCGYMCRDTTVTADDIAHIDRDDGLLVLVVRRRRRVQSATMVWQVNVSN